MLNKLGQNVDSVALMIKAELGKKTIDVHRYAF